MPTLSYLAFASIALQPVSQLPDPAAGHAHSTYDTPMPGVLDRLIVFAENSTDEGVRAAALAAMLLTPEHSRAVKYVAKVAGSDKPIAKWAMAAMLDEVNPHNAMTHAASKEDVAETQSALKTIWARYCSEILPERNNWTLTVLIPGSTTIPNADALDLLATYAAANRWGGRRVDGSSGVVF